MLTAFGAIDLQGGGGFAPNQTYGGKFRCGKLRAAPWVECITPRQSPQCVLLVCEKFAENPEFRVGNFANLKREISNAKLKCHENPPPPCMWARIYTTEEDCWQRTKCQSIEIRNRT